MRSFADSRAGKERLRERLCFMEKTEVCVGTEKESREGERLKGQWSEKLVGG